jgi:FAD/FMN-containing dehydrogenase
MMGGTGKVLTEVSKLAIELAGVFWKPTIDEQRITLEKMGPVTKNLMKMIKENLDPQWIMNPGNWEVV